MLYFQFATQEAKPFFVIVAKQMKILIWRLLASIKLNADVSNFNYDYKLFI